MRNLKDRIAEKELADQDDRDMVSRSDRKRARTSVEDAIAGLGEQIVGLNPRQLASIKLSEPVLDMVADAQKIKSPIARARQMRLVRRELRAVDWEAIQEELAEFLAHGFPARPKTAPPPAEPVKQWLDLLVADGDSAIERLLAEQPGTDRQQLRARLRSFARATGASKQTARQKLIDTISEGLASA